MLIFFSVKLKSMSSGCEQFGYMVTSHCSTLARKRWTRIGLLISGKWLSNCYWPCPCWPVSKLWSESINRNIPFSLVFFIIQIVTACRLWVGVSRKLVGSLWNRLQSFCIHRLGPNVRVSVSRQSAAEVP